MFQCGCNSLAGEIILAAVGSAVGAATTWLLQKLYEGYGKCKYDFNAFECLPEFAMIFCVDVRENTYRNSSFWSPIITVPKGSEKSVKTGLKVESLQNWAHSEKSVIRKKGLQEAKWSLFIRKYVRRILDLNNPMFLVG